MERKIRSRLRRHALEHDLVGMIHRVRLGDLGVIDLVSAQVFFQALQRAVGISVHRVVHLHLQNQVGAALQIEPQMDVVLQRRQQPLPEKSFGTPKMPNRNTTRVATVSPSFQPKDLFMA